jgi:predicted transcriptional regulator
MRVAEEADSLRLQVLTGETELGREVTGGCASDLLSYVMSNAKAGYVWITIQVHPSIVGVADLLDLAAVVVAGGQEPQAATLEKARQHGVAILTSRETAFTLAGRLYEMGVR